MIYSGIDWSGDVGDPAKSSLSPLFVTVIAHIDGQDLPLLAQTLDGVRAARGLPPRFAFRYSSSSERVRAAFFAAICHVPITARASIIDKRTWGPATFRSRGWDRINQCIADVVCGCPPELIAGQVVLIDQPKHETAAVRGTAATLKRALQGVGIAPFPQIKPCPDHRAQGLVIQVADMVAGALHDAGGVTGAYLAPLAGRITVT